MDQAGRGSAHGRPARGRAGAGVRAGTARRRAKRAAGSVGRLRRMVSPPEGIGVVRATTGMTPMVLAAWENTNAASGQLF
ncbi:hypothetical protein C7S13_4212 [Burkholderia cepacia]|nr:hypothetical protein [Burkholderia cepacia]QOH39896.1 hypothetical protein C7S14_2138 [Burkholderia cepacia]